MSDTVGSIKTGQNLERLNKISDKLNAIHYNIQTDKNNKYMEVEGRLNLLEQKMNESQDDVVKEFNQTKKDIAALIQSIEEDRQQFDAAYEARTQYLSNLEFKLMQKFNDEQENRKNMEARLFNQIDNCTNTLKNELMKEEQNRNESISNFKTYLESEVPKIVNNMKIEQEDRELADTNLNSIIEGEFNKLTEMLEAEKNSRQETEEAFLDMLRSIINKIKVEIETEKKNREATEENLLSLLEETCKKLDMVAKSQ